MSTGIHGPKTVEWFLPGLTPGPDQDKQNLGPAWTWTKKILKIPDQLETDQEKIQNHEPDWTSTKKKFLTRDREKTPNLGLEQDQQNFENLGLIRTVYVDEKCDKLCNYENKPLKLLIARFKIKISQWDWIRCIL